MSKDVECPYCGAEQDINHDDGYGYAEDEKHQQECCKCGKTFVFETTIVFYYDTFKADCLNDAECEFEITATVPECMSQMECKHCGERRGLTDEERKTYGIGTLAEYLKEIRQ